MVWIDEVKRIIVGDRDYFYQAVWNDKGSVQAVNLVNGSGEYITSFHNVADMKEFMTHAEPESVKRELDAIYEFRKRSAEFLEREKGNKTERSISQEEKDETSSAVMKRVQILKGNMTIWEFGKALGLNGGTAYNIVCGARNVSAHSLKRIADRCGVTTDWILGREEDGTKKV